MSHALKVVVEDPPRKTLKSIVASLTLGLSIPFIFALYSVYVGSISPVSSQLKPLAGIQIGFFALLLSCLPGLLPLLSTEKNIREKISRDSKDLLLLNIFTLLGPPLYFAAIVLLGAGPANWIDLGVTPILTLLAGLILGRDSQSHRLTYLSVLLAMMGVGLIMWDLYRQTSSPSSGIQTLGITLALLSAVGTTGAGIYLSKLQRNRTNPLSPSVLLPLRYVLPAIILGGMWILEGNRIGHHGIVLSDNIVLIIVAIVSLYVFPNYLYNLVLKKRALIFSGYLWALLPAIGSGVEFLIYGPQKMSLSPAATVISGIMILTATLIGME